MQPFRIGESYRVEPSLNRVTGPGGIHRLEPKVMLVLVCLAERAGQVVPKDRLVQSAWADTAVTDDVLTRAISELRRLFGDDPRQPRVIETIAKGGYRLIAPVVGLGAPDAISPASTSHIPAGARRGWRGVTIVAAAIVVALAAGVWLSRTHRSPPAVAMRVVPITAMSGSEYGAAFSPDGRQLAFAWNGEIPNGEIRAWWGGSWDIYVKLVGSSEMRRLTTDPGMDLSPAWSPDGRQIAYVRSEPPHPYQRIRVMSSLGGSDRVVSDFPIWLPATWSPDGRYLVAGRAGPPDAAHPTNGLYLIPVQGGEPRAITKPAAPGVDQSPAFSPDGHHLAYASCDEQRTYCHVQAVNLDAAFAAVGSPRQLTGLLRMPLGSVTWSRDGQFVIFNAEEMQLNYLWRVAVDGQPAPERIEQAGVGAFFPSTSPVDDRLAFTRMLHDEDVYAFEPGRSAASVARSSVFDGNPQFSPDGQRMAFCSLRSGDAMEIWAANADGSSPAQLTHGPNRYQCGPAWSPDGRRIAFESAAEDEHPHIWTIDTQGGTPRQITNDPGDQLDPSWSQRWQLDLLLLGPRGRSRHLARAGCGRRQGARDARRRIRGAGVDGRHRADLHLEAGRFGAPGAAAGRWPSACADRLRGGHRVFRRTDGDLLSAVFAHARAGPQSPGARDESGDEERLANSAGSRSISTGPFHPASRCHPTARHSSTTVWSGMKPT